MLPPLPAQKELSPMPPQTKTPPTTCPSLLFPVRPSLHYPDFPLSMAFSCQPVASSSSLPIDDLFNPLYNIQAKSSWIKGKC